jgi:hypothetical protein
VKPRDLGRHLLAAAPDRDVAVRQWHALHLVRAYDQEDARAVAVYARHAAAGPDTDVIAWEPVLRHMVLAAMLLAVKLHPGNPKSPPSAGETAKITGETHRLLHSLTPAVLEPDALTAADYLIRNLPSVPLFEPRRWNRGMAPRATLHAAAALTATLSRMPQVQRQNSGPGGVDLVGAMIIEIEDRHGPIPAPITTAADDISAAIPADARRLGDGDRKLIDVHAAELLLAFLDQNPAAVQSSVSAIDPYGERGYRIAYSHISNWGANWQDKIIDGPRRVGSRTWVPIFSDMIDTLVPETKRHEAWITYLPFLKAVTQEGGTGVPHPTGAVEADLFVLAAYAATFGRLIPDQQDLDTLRLSLGYLRRPQRRLTAAELPDDDVAAGRTQLRRRFGDDFAAAVAEVPKPGSTTDELLAVACEIAATPSDDADEHALAWLTHLQESLQGELVSTAHDRAQGAPTHTTDTAAQESTVAQLRRPTASAAGGGDPFADEVLSAMPPAFREMAGRVQAWVTYLVLAYADGLPDEVRSRLAQIDAWRRPLGDGAAAAMPQWRSAHLHASALFDELHHTAGSQPQTSATAVQISMGAVQILRACGPSDVAQRALTAAREFSAGDQIAAFDDLPEEERDKASTAFWAAAAGWIFNQAFLSRESGRLALVTKAREGEQIALGAPSPEWRADIPDAVAITLIGDVLDLRPELLPPPDPHRRNLLELDLVSAAKLFLLEHPAAEPEDLAQLRTRLTAMITAFNVPAPQRPTGDERTARQAAERALRTRKKHGRGGRR